MANELQFPHTTAVNVYAVILNGAGEIYNGSAFEAIEADNWATYDIALTEADGTGIYKGTFPVIAAGKYQAIAYERASSSPATTDTVIGVGEMVWGGAAEVVQSGDAYARLGAPAGASIAADIATKSTLTAQQVWEYGTRTLSSFGTLVADTVSGVWGAATRTLSAFGFTVDTNANATETAIKAKTDNLPASPAAVGSAMTLDSAVLTQIEETHTVITAVSETGPVVVIPSASADDSQCACYLYTYDAAQDIQGGVTHSFRLADTPAGSGASYGPTIEATSDATTGLLSIDLKRNTAYVHQRVAASAWDNQGVEQVSFTTPNTAGPYAIPNSKAKS